MPALSLVINRSLLLNRYHALDKKNEKEWRGILLFDLVTIFLLYRLNY